MKLKFKMALCACLSLFFFSLNAKACDESSPICVTMKSNKIDLKTGKRGSRSFSNSGSSLISEAHRWLGASARQMGVPSRLWCMDGLNVWLANTGHKTVNSRRAIDALKLGPRIDYARVGAVAVTKRRGGHHVSVILADNGNTFTAISPNHNRAVGIGEYPKRIVVAYVQPQ